MKRTAGQLGLAPPECICDPMDLAALGHMTNCPALRSTDLTANETDWKARCEAAEQALEGRDKFLVKRGMWDAFVSQLDGGKP